MILDEYINITLTANNVKHFKENGYVLPTRINSRRQEVTIIPSIIRIKTTDLRITSAVKIRVQCEDCKKIRLINYESLHNRPTSTYKLNRETPCIVCSTKRRTGDNNKGWSGGKVFNRYKRTAPIRGYVFELTLEQFNEIVVQNCFYCNDKNAKGIDRVDNTKGYVLSNCVPCCKPCNFIKLTMPFEEFISKIAVMYHNLKSKGIIKE